MTPLAHSAPPEAFARDQTLLVQQLFVKHQSAIRAFILSLRPDFAEAEDILQEVFLTVSRKGADFRPDSSFIAWAFTIARFKVLEVQRQKFRKGAAVLSEEVIETLAATLPEEGFFESRLEGICKCLEKLAPRSQEIVRLRYFGEHGPEEIARILDWKANAVNVALSKARVALRDCMRRYLKEA